MSDFKNCKQIISFLKCLKRIPKTLNLDNTGDIELKVNHYLICPELKALFNDNTGLPIKDLTSGNRIESIHISFDSIYLE
jgi:hypothetical protein